MLIFLGVVQENRGDEFCEHTVDTGNSSVVQENIIFVCCCVDKNILTNLILHASRMLA